MLRKYHICLVIRMGISTCKFTPVLFNSDVRCVFSFQNNVKDLDPS